MVCTRKNKPLMFTCVILSRMSKIPCLLYVGWMTNYMTGLYVPPISTKLEPEDKGAILSIIDRLEHLDSVINQYIQGTTPNSAPHQEYMVITVCTSHVSSNSTYKVPNSVPHLGITLHTMCTCLYIMCTCL